MYKGIDISTFQNVTSWSKVKKEVDFVLIRTGFGNSINQIDNKFKSHMEGAIKAGIKTIGVYHFSYARSPEEAKKEARVCLEIIKPYKDKVNMFVAYDWEYDSYDYALKNGIKPTRKLITDMANAFCKVIASAGFIPCVYTNLDYASNRFNMSELSPGIRVWIAQYNNTLQYKGKYDVWQYSSAGKVSGIEGNVDMNYCYNEKYFKKEFTMNYGEINDGILAVKELLFTLQDLGVIKVSLNEDGGFGDGTLKAVKAAQKAAGIEQSGKIDAKTIRAIRGLIKKELAKSPFDVNKDGKVNMEDVVDLQRKIADR